MARTSRRWLAGRIRCGTIPRNQRRRGPIIPDNPNWHRHKNWCPLYRERWGCRDEPDGQGGVLLYQIICLQDTPPETEAEQARCMIGRNTCWRVADAARAAKKQRRKSGVGSEEGIAS